jgi:hypothetical protein
VYESFREYEERKTKRFIDYLWVGVLLYGTGVYWFVLLQAVLFVVFVYLGIRAHWISTIPISHVFRILLVAIFSITSAEILVDIFVNRRQEFHVVVWPLLIAHVAFCGFLLFRIFRQKPAETT